MITYATLNQLKERLQIVADDTANDTALLRALWQATAQIDRHTARRFAPTVQTRTYAYQDPYCLRLDIDLLQLSPPHPAHQTACSSTPHRAPNQAHLAPGTASTRYYLRFWAATTPVKFHRR